MGRVGQHRGMGWTCTQGGAGGSCCPVHGTSWDLTCAHTPECHDLLLAWAFIKVPALGTPAWPNRGISAQVAPNQLLMIWISEQEESKEPGGWPWAALQGLWQPHTDPVSCGMSLFDLCPTLHLQVPSSLSIFSPFSPGQQPQGSVCVPGEAFSGHGVKQWGQQEPSKLEFVHRGSVSGQWLSRSQWFCIASC